MASDLSFNRSFFLHFPSTGFWASIISVRPSSPAIVLVTSPNETFSHNFSFRSYRFPSASLSVSFSGGNEVQNMPSSTRTFHARRHFVLLLHGDFIFSVSFLSLELSNSSLSQLHA
jgi:hypothetical protein